VLGYLFLLGLLTGCGKPPQKEIEAAKAAIDSARAAEADLYARPVIELAQAALARSDSSVAVKDYSRAKTFALRAKQLADSSITVAMQQKQQRKSEATRLMDQVRGLVDSLKAVVYLPGKKLSAEVQKHVARVDSLVNEAKNGLRPRRQSRCHRRGTKRPSGGGCTETPAYPQAPIKAKSGMTLINPDGRTMGHPGTDGWPDLIVHRRCPSKVHLARR